MKRCWIHIGMHKTSSTSVQGNLKKMKKSTGSKLFTVGGCPNMGPALHAMFLEAPEKCSWFSKKGQSPEDIAKCGRQWLEELKNSILSFQGEVCILSGETLTESLFDERSIVALRDFLTPLFDGGVKVIGYVRSPYQYKNSRLQERIKSSTAGFDLDLVKLDYRARFEKWDKIFGDENVLLIKFDPSTFPNGCAVADFCNQIGIQIPPDLEIRRFNESLSQNACGILHAYRKFGQGYGLDDIARVEKAYLIRALRGMGGKKFTLSRQVLEPAVNSEREDIAWMERRLGVSLNEPNNDGGLGITSEENLLEVSRESCEEFVKCFEQTYNVRIKPPFVAASDPVDPKLVAELVESSRVLCRELVAQKLESDKIIRPPPRNRPNKKPVRWYARISRIFRTLFGKRKPRQASHSASLNRMPVESVAGTAKRWVKK